MREEQTDLNVLRDSDGLERMHLNMPRRFLNVYVKEALHQMKMAKNEKDPARKAARLKIAEDNLEMEVKR